MSHKRYKLCLRVCDNILFSLPSSIFLILLISFISILGALFPSLGVFRSGWFLAALSYIGFAMIYCTARRLPESLKAYFNPGDNLEKINSKKEIFHFSVLEKNKLKLQDFFDRVLCKKGYKKSFLPGNTGTGKQFFYEKAKFSIFGSYIVHLGLAVILVAGIITSWRGIFYDVNIKEGEAITVGERLVTLEKFSIIPNYSKYEEDEYASRLRVNRPGFPPEWHTLKVNSPIGIDGHNLYQMRYSYDIESLTFSAYRGSSKEPLETAAGSIDKRIVFPELDIAIEVKDFIPDFAVDKKGGVSSRSRLLRNPACYISVYSPPSSGKTVQEGWVFRNFVAPHEEKDGYKWKFEVDNVKIRYSSGIKVTKNPGSILTYLGLIFLVAGSFLSCHKFYRRLMIQTEAHSEDGTFSVRCFAFKAKNMFEFDRELKDITKELSERFNNL